MRQFCAALLLGSVGIAALAVPASAAGKPVHEHAGAISGHTKVNAPSGQGAPTSSAAPVNWNQHDTAVYVVSTINLLHTRTGRALTDVLSKKMAVTRFDVYADTSTANLYFVQLRRDDGTVVGALAYTMGWPRPRVIFLGSRVQHRSPDRISAAYRSDPKTLIGSFSSTLPQ